MKINPVASTVAGAVALGLVLGSAATRELWPRTEYRTLPVAPPVTIDISDSTRADYEERIEAWRSMAERLDRRVAELAARPPIVTRDTQFVEVPVQVACDAESFEPRWRIAELVVGEEWGDETLIRSEEISADSGSVIFRPRLERHVTPGPLLGAWPGEDGVRLSWGQPPPEPCDFWCRMSLRGEGAAVGVLGTALACLLR